MYGEPELMLIEKDQNSGNLKGVYVILENYDTVRAPPMQGANEFKKSYI